jgi:hypothetical protein
LFFEIVPHARTVVVGEIGVKWAVEVNFSLSDQNAYRHSGETFGDGIHAVRHIGCERLPIRLKKQILTACQQYAVEGVTAVFQFFEHSEQIGRANTARFGCGFVKHRKTSLKSTKR